MTRKLYPRIPQCLNHQKSCDQLIFGLMRSLVHAFCPEHFYTAAGRRKTYKYRSAHSIRCFNKIQLFKRKSGHHSRYHFFIVAQKPWVKTSKKRFIDHSWSHHMFAPSHPNHPTEVVVFPFSEPRLDVWISIWLPWLPQLGHLVDQSWSRSGAGWWLNWSSWKIFVKFEPSSPRVGVQIKKSLKPPLVIQVGGLVLVWLCWVVLEAIDPCALTGES